MLSCFLLGKQICPLGKDPWRLAPGFLQISPHVPYPQAGFVVYPFTEINHKQEQDCMLNPGSPSSESPSLGVVWATPDTSSTIYSSHFMKYTKQPQIHLRLSAPWGSNLAGFIYHSIVSICHSAWHTDCEYLKYWVGQKVCSGFSLRCYKKPE